ncbi:MAG: erythromycin esterase family protein [Thermoleophilia bacterium]|nr:erythromycin esterase family protein [Thermoleophilia bacterium]
MRRIARPLRGSAAADDRLLALAAGARIVLIGEASHGTREFYAERAAVTRRLIEEHGFDAVAVEADWPDAYRVNRYVSGDSDEASAEEALRGFQRFPRWMWRNREVVAFVEWLRACNARSAHRPVGFYGLDLYSLYASMDAVIRYLEGVDAEAAGRARERYACFDHPGEPQDYGYRAAFGAGESCEDEAVRQLVEVMSVDGRVQREDAFYARQNARLVRNAERYYRSMFDSRVSSWNVRDRHMAETLGELAGHLDRPGRSSRVVVWEHNSHIGDASATELGRAGEVNVGQLARQRWPGETALIGFTTYRGSVTAAASWDEPGVTMRVRDALPGSYEHLFHEVGEERFVAVLEGDAADALAEPRLERAIGVVYRPETERLSHYFHASLPAQFDAVIHLDETAAVEPLDAPAVDEAAAEEPPETFPSAV